MKGPEFYSDKLIVALQVWSFKIDSKANLKDKKEMFNNFKTCKW